MSRRYKPKEKQQNYSNQSDIKCRFCEQHEKKKPHYDSEPSSVERTIYIRALEFARPTTLKYV